MTERFWVSAADPNIAKHLTPSGFEPFRRELFGEFLRTLLVSLYSDMEILVANFLLEHIDRSAFTEAQLAEQLYITSRQVKAVLEGRLIKDCIVEVEHPAGGQSGAWYRINPNVLIATSWRMAHLEKSLVERLHEAKQSENFTCSQCGREYDLLRAVSVGGFFCEVCPDVELQPQDNRAIRLKLEAQIKRMHMELASLRDSLRRCERMYVPRPVVVKRSLQREVEEMEKKQQEFSQAKAEAFTHSSSGPHQSNRPIQESAAPHWIPGRKGVVDLEVETEEKRFSVTAAQVTATAQKLLISPTGSSVKVDLTKLLLEKTPKIESDPSEGLFVTVAGKEHALRELLDNDTLVDKMTDQEYDQYDQILLQYRAVKSAK